MPLSSFTVPLVWVAPAHTLPSTRAWKREEREKLVGEVLTDVGFYPLLPPQLGAPSRSRRNETGPIFRGAGHAQVAQLSRPDTGALLAQQSPCFPRAEKNTLMMAAISIHLLQLNPSLQVQYQFIYKAILESLQKRLSKAKQVRCRLLSLPFSSLTTMFPYLRPCVKP